MRAPEDLSRGELIAVVTAVQEALWLDEEGGRPRFNPNKDWDSGTLDEISAALAGCELNPIEVIDLNGD